jgi:hypothetical protein
MILLRVLALFFVLPVISVHASSEGRGGATITVVISKGLDSAHVTVTGAAGLQGFSDRVWRNVDDLENGKLSRRGVVRLQPDEPVSYVSDIVSSRRGRLAVGQSDIKVADWTHWLLMPDDWHMRKPVPVKVIVPDDGAAVLPFELIDQQPGQTRYLSYPLLPRHGGISAFGNVQVHPMKFGDFSLNVSILGGEGGEGGEKNGYRGWLETVVNAASESHKAPPGKNALIVLAPVAFTRGTVPWAHVKRGGGSHVIAYVNQSSTVPQLLDDWTLFHEVMHLYHPYLQGKDRWVSEGFASYFQNLYRATAGVVTPESAYEKLAAGLERGRTENERAGRVLVTEGGRMRTYWTGAAMAVNADYLIRDRTAGEKTLATVLGEFATANLPTQRSWRAREFMQALDEVLGFEMMVPILRQVARDRSFPVLVMDKAAIIQMLSPRNLTADVGAVGVP